VNDVSNTITTVLNAILNALGVALGTVAKTMLQNIHATEWIVGLLLILSIWLLVRRRGNSIFGFALLVLTVGVGAWLSWTTGHTGGAVQQVGLAVLGLHGLLKSRGWALVQGAAK
jgi:hypothetical protein